MCVQTAEKVSLDDPSLETTTLTVLVHSNNHFAISARSALHIRLLLSLSINILT